MKKPRYASLLLLDKRIELFAEFILRLLLRYVNWIIAGKAGVAEAGGGTACDLVQALKAQIGQISSMLIRQAIRYSRELISVPK